MMRSRFFALALLATIGLLVVHPPASQAHSYERNASSEHFLRYVAYFVHPIGLVAEYAVMRPVHYLVSQPDCDILFGHKAYLQKDVFFEWKHGDHAMGLREESEMLARKRGAVHTPASDVPPSDSAAPPAAPPESPDASAKLIEVKPEEQPQTPPPAPEPPAPEPPAPEPPAAPAPAQP